MSSHDIHHKPVSTGSINHDQHEEPSIPNSKNHEQLQPPPALWSSAVRSYALVGSWDDWLTFHPLQFSEGGAILAAEARENGGTQGAPGGLGQVAWLAMVLVDVNIAFLFGGSSNGWKQGSTKVIWGFCG